MYPTIVIVLVKTQLSMMDICNINSSNASQYSRALQSGREHALEEIILEVKESQVNTSG